MWRAGGSVRGLFGIPFQGALDVSMPRWYLVVLQVVKDSIQPGALDVIFYFPAVSRTQTTAATDPDAETRGRVSPGWID